MRSMGAWFGRLAMAGACLSWAGCGGGGDVPDPDSDSRAATSEPSRPVSRPAPDAAEKPEAEALASNTPPAAETPKADPTDKSAEAEKAAPAPAAPVATPAKGDSSGTDEMFRMPATPNSPPPAGEASGTSNEARPGKASLAGAPGIMGGPGGRPEGGGAAITPGVMGASGPGPATGGAAVAPGTANATPQPSGGAGGVMGPKGGMRDARGPGGPAGPGNFGEPGAAGGPEGGKFASPGGPPGGAGFGGMNGPGGPGGPGGSGTPPNYNYPNTAVTAFLDALKARNKDRLAEATARRAPTEAVEKHRKIFSEIVDGSISDDELDEMSKALDGYRVRTVLEAKSSARIGVIVVKQSTDGGYMQRTIETRREKEGSDLVWKVVDIDEAYNFKPMMQFNNRNGRAKTKSR